MKTVLFACVHNAGRSQMAAAWFNKLADLSKARSISAGTEPGARIHPEVVAAMREVGVDLSTGVPRKLTDDIAAGVTMLVTMGCGEACPVVPGARREDWPLEDPKGKPLARVRKIRDEVRDLVAALLRREGWSDGTRPAREDDEPKVLALLAAAVLPTAGVEHHFESFVVAEDAAGDLAGAAGLELYGVDALLRSVVVSESRKGTGIGSNLTRRALDEARARGVCDVFLLTTTADGFFLRFGFERVARHEVPSRVQGSRELQGACPASATAMRLRLKPTP
jgi:arsenate reductase